MSDIYKNKYIKYKKKFLDLKNTNFELNQQGGELTFEEIDLWNFIAKGRKESMEYTIRTLQKTFNNTFFFNSNIKMPLDYYGNTYLHAAIDEVAEQDNENFRNERLDLLLSLIEEIEKEKNLEQNKQLHYRIFSTMNQEKYGDSSRFMKYKIPLIYAIDRLEKPSYYDSRYAPTYLRVIKKLFENTINSMDPELGMIFLQNINGVGPEFIPLLLPEYRQLGDVKFSKMTFPGEVKINIENTNNKLTKDQLSKWIEDKEKLNYLINRYNENKGNEYWIIGWVDNNLYKKLTSTPSIPVAPAEVASSSTVAKKKIRYPKQQQQLKVL